jgi:hypothetical protein
LVNLSLFINKTSPQNFIICIWPTLKWYGMFETQYED